MTEGGGGPEHGGAAPGDAERELVEQGQVDEAVEPAPEPTPEQPSNPEADELAAKLAEAFPTGPDGRPQPMRIQGRGEAPEAKASRGRSRAEEVIATSSTEPANAAAEKEAAISRYAEEHGEEVAGIEPIKSAASRESDEPPAKASKSKSKPKPRPRPPRAPKPPSKPPTEEPEDDTSAEPSSPPVSDYKPRRRPVSRPKPTPPPEIVAAPEPESESKSEPEPESTPQFSREELDEGARRYAEAMSDPHELWKVANELAKQGMLEGNPTEDGKGTRWIAVNDEIDKVFRSALADQSQAASEAPATAEPQQLVPQAEPQPQPEPQSEPKSGRVRRGVLRGKHGGPDVDLPDFLDTTPEPQPVQQAGPQPAPEPRPKPESAPEFSQTEIDDAARRYAEAINDPDQLRAVGEDLLGKGIISEHITEGGKKVDWIPANIEIGRAFEAAIRETRPTAEQTPLPPLAPRLEFHAIDMDAETRNRALAAAEHRLETEMADAKGIQGITRRIWKGTWAHEYYRQRYAREFEAQIRHEDNLLLFEGKDSDAYHAAMASLIDRLSVSHPENPHSLALHRGESITEMGDSPEQRALQDEVRTLIRRYATGELTAEALHEERTRLFDGLSRTEALGGAHMIADNLITMAEQAKASVDHGISLDQMLAEMRFYADEARAGVRTEVRRTIVDRAVEKITGSKAGLFINEATIASSVAIAYSAATVVSRSTFGAATRIAPHTSIAAAAFAGLRENVRYKQERAQHMREVAEGTAVNLERGRRKTMEELRYSTKSASELIAGIQIPYSTENLSATEARALFANLAEIRARIQISDSDQLDLISFSSVEKVEDERFELDLAVATAQRRLRDWWELHASEANRGMIVSSLTDADAYMDALHIHTEAAAMGLNTEIAKTDRAFARMKVRAVGAAFAKGALVGAVAGAVVQEAEAFTSPDLQGELASLVGVHDHATHQTLLRDIIAHFQGTNHTAQTSPVGLGGPGTPGGHPLEIYPQSQAPSPNHAASSFIERVDGHNTVKLPRGYRLSHQSAGAGLTLTGAGNQPHASGLHMDAHGFTPQSQAELGRLGIVSEHQTVSLTGTRSVARPVSVRDYFAQSHPPATQAVERTAFYDNNTPAASDGNELRLDWGAGGHGYTGNSYEFSISHMTAGGSTHDGLSTNAQELMRQGKLRMLFSASAGTQSHPFSVNIDSHGNAVIDKNNTLGRSLFSHHGDQAEFRGRYAEVAQVVGEHDGHEQVRILATYEGKGVDTIRQMVRPSGTRLVTTLHVPGAQPAAMTSGAGGPASITEAAEVRPANEPGPITDYPPPVAMNSFRRELEPATIAPPQFDARPEDNDHGDDDGDATEPDTTPAPQPEPEPTPTQPQPASPPQTQPPAADAAAATPPPRRAATRAAATPTPETQQPRNWKAALNTQLQAAKSNPDRIAAFVEALEHLSPQERREGAIYITNAALRLNLLTVKPLDIDEDSGGDTIRLHAARGNSSAGPLADALKAILGDTMPSDLLAESAPPQSRRTNPPSRRSGGTTRRRGQGGS